MNGAFHVVGSSFINRYDWAIKTCKFAGWDGSLIIKIRDIPDNIIPRPLKSSLNTGKFRNSCKTKLGNVEEGIKSFVESMNKECRILSRKDSFESKRYSSNL